MKISATDVRGSRVEPDALMGYLRSRGWLPINEFPRGDMPASVLMGKDEAEGMVPLRAEAKDYAWLVARLVNVVARLEDRPAQQVLSDLGQYRADVVRLRRTGRDDSSIPLAVGASLFGVVHNLMAAASLAAASQPRPSYSGRRPKQVTDFMQKALIGQTEPGSFVIRVVVPLPHQIRSPQKDLFADSPAATPDPFERRVTIRLMHALRAVRRALLSTMVENSLDPFQGEVEQGVSAELCRALSGIALDTESGGAEFSVSWGMAIPRRASEPVFFKESDLSVLRQAADYLAETEPRNDFELEGYITQLSRGTNVPENEGGDITVAANVDDRVRKVKVQLSPGLYRLACDAHRQEKKVSLTGELGKEGRQFRLVSARNFRVSPSADDTD